MSRKVFSTAFFLAAGVTCSSPEAPIPNEARDEFAWTLASPCPVARFEANTAVVGAELWVMGGFVSSDLEVTRRVDIYDPMVDSWRSGPDLPGAETHLAVVTSNGDIIVAGGFAGNFVGSRPPPTEAVHRLNVATEEWTDGPTLPTRGAAFAWALVGTEFHVAGGLAADGNSDADVHHVWDLAGPEEWSSSENLPNARNHGGGAATHGLFYAIAGRHGWNERSGADAAVHAFDPVDGTWIARSEIPAARSEIGAATMTLSDGRILVAGGSLTGIVPTDDVLIYDPTRDAWSTLPPLPEPRKGAVAAQVGRYIVVTTGSPTSIDPSATTFIGCCLAP
jgi:non-specific serine/threonine protein kinase